MGQYHYPLPPERPRPNWFGRNWKWVVPVGCLTIILVAVVAVGVGIAFVLGILRSSDAYVQAVAQAKADGAVISALGTPIEEGFLVTGSVQTHNSSGEADLVIPISGPKGSAKIYAEARRSAGMWTFTVLQVEIKGQAERIDLLRK